MTNSNLPWYKQFWPWFLIFIPVITLVMSSYLIVLAFSTDDSMVIDDYYKEGKAINQQLTKLQNAKDLQIQSSFEVDEQQIKLKIHANPPLNGAALTMYFHHATIKRFDFKLLLTQNAQGLYTADLPEPLTGKWAVTLMPFDEAWKIQQKLTFPYKGTISFNP